jgi:hypothetical protein
MEIDKFKMQLIPDASLTWIGVVIWVVSTISNLELLNHRDRSILDIILSFEISLAHKLPSRHPRNAPRQAFSNGAARMSSTNGS